MVQSALDLLSIEKYLCELAQKHVGPIIKAKSGTQHTYDAKSGSRAVDIVTAIDKQVEKLIWDNVKQKYPEFKFIGEESYVAGQTKITDEPTFIIDPIDGTTNFVHDFPFSCTSLGLAINKEPVVGVIYNPHLDLLVSASRDNGMRVNGQDFDFMAKKHEMGPLHLAKSVVALQPGSAREGPNFTTKMKTYEKLLSCDGGFVHGFRNLGSSAMTLAYICLGYLDSYWDGGCYAWDVCAGWCILRETGGRIVGANPGEWEVPVDNRTYLAVRGCENKQEQNEYIEKFWDCVEGKLNYT
ncbi:LANO_0H10088g1_1 [Lachancea nothofagi CBS 11611]|uniref:Inositol-1-monophosphatase n=1 Tax=Lachancea nothofagi CBS 11611 TaxID=1266666 RepID=A0A1G4KLW0_9SACH|nr:LANO_0H10088g1_1 [Lachancea nothofagi CBS 11611]